MGGTALRNQDFTGDDATLKFEDGETRKGDDMFVLITSTVINIVQMETHSEIDAQDTNKSFKKYNNYYQQWRLFHSSNQLIGN